MRLASSVSAKAFRTFLIATFWPVSRFSAALARTKTCLQQLAKYNGFLRGRVHDNAECTMPNRLDDTVLLVNVKRLTGDYN
jgi:hypothetical protein